MDFYVNKNVLWKDMLEWWVIENILLKNWFVSNYCWVVEIMEFRLLVKFSLLVVIVEGVNLIWFFVLLWLMYEWF